MRRSLFLIFGLLLLAAPASAQVMAGQSDDFNDGTTQDWRNGRNTDDVSNVGTGGPDGAGDGYLQINADGSLIAGRLVAFNTDQWIGDWTAAGITSVTMDLNNTGVNPLTIRLWIEGPGGTFVSDDNVALPVGSGWQSASFSVDPADLIASGGTDVDATLADVTRFRIYHGPAPSAPGPNIVGLLGVDNVTAEGSMAPNFDLVATNTTPLIVPRGGSISFTYSIANNTANPATGSLWFTASPGGLSGIIQSGTLPGGQTVNGNYTQNVPANAPVGTYTYNLNIGVFPNGIIDSETFTVMVTAARPSSDSPTLSAPLTTWPVVDAKPWSLVQDLAAMSSAVPERLALHAAYPNPFKTTTALGFDVPEATGVTVTVYDVLGREVAVLLDGAVEAGQHTVRFDGNGLSRGVYLVRLQTADVSEVRRVTLVR